MAIDKLSQLRSFTSIKDTATTTMTLKTTVSTIQVEQMYSAKTIPSFFGAAITKLYTKYGSDMLFKMSGIKNALMSLPDVAKISKYSHIGMATSLTEWFLCGLGNAWGGAGGNAVKCTGKAVGLGGNI